MQLNNPAQESLEFIKSFKTEDEVFSLSSGVQISIQKYFLTFSEWKGEPILNTYGNKAVLDFNNEPLFAELAVLKLFIQNGWGGVWVDSYRRKFRVGMPYIVPPSKIPQKQQEFIDSIRAKTGRFGGCWDLLLWNDESVLFVELKRQKKDVIQDSQKEWLEKSLEMGLTIENFTFVEWT